MTKKKKKPDENQQSSLQRDWNDDDTSGIRVMSLEEYAKEFGGPKFPSQQPSSQHKPQKQALDGAELAQRVQDIFASTPIYHDDDARESGLEDYHISHEAAERYAKKLFGDGK